MSATQYGRSGQPTPPAGELEYDLHHIARHNAGNTAYTHQQQDTLDFAYRVPDTIEPGIDYHPDDYGQTSLHPHGAYGKTSHQYSYDDVSTRTPPTPRSNNASDSARRTRSGRAIRTDSPMSAIRDDSSRVTKSPRPAKKGKKSKSNPIHLRAPLSELTRESELPVKDMKAHINRPVEVRIKEARDRQEKKGKGNKGVPRPMNSFMLYRSAYAERCKEWALQHNHQVVSSISGASWPLETAEIRRLYTELAEEERVKHREAHPSYKFAPSKPGNGVLSKEDDYDDEGFSENDPDGEYAPSRRLARQARRTPTQQTYQDLAQYSGAYPHAVPSNTNASNWNIITGPERPMSAQYQAHQYFAQQYHPQQYQAQQYQSLQYQPQQHSQQYPPPQYQPQPYPDQYFSAPVQHHHQYNGYEQVEDVRMTVNPTPSVSGHDLVSLPGGGHQDLIQPRTQTPVQSYQQPQMGGNFLNTSAMMYADQNDPQNIAGYDVLVGQDSHSSESFQQVTPQAIMTQSKPEDWKLDPTLADSFNEYAQYLDE